MNNSNKLHPQNFFPVGQICKAIAKLKEFEIKPDADGNILMSRYGFHDPIKSFWVGGKPLGSNTIVVDVAVEQKSLGGTSVGGES